MCQKNYTAETSMKKAMRTNDPVEMKPAIKQEVYSIIKKCIRRTVTQSCTEE